MLLLLPGRRHLLTNHRLALLTLLTQGESAHGPVEGVAWVITSANHAGTRRNPLPAHRREAAIEEFAALLEPPSPARRRSLPPPRRHRGRRPDGDARLQRLRPRLRRGADRKDALVEGHVRPGRIVDIGCCTGALLARLTRDDRLRESDFYGIELARPLYAEKR
jgi:hypothetical protein